MNVNRHRPRMEKTVRLRTAVWRKFCGTTVLHGFKYLLRPAPEKAAWSAVIWLSLAAAAALLQHKWRQYLSLGATVTSLDTAHLPVYRLPFPAVSVCPINKVHRDSARRLLADMNLPEGMSLDEGVQQLGKLVELIEPRERNVDRLRFAQAILDLNNVSLDVFMRKISPSCDSMLPLCKWKGRTHRCSDIFVLRKTFEGYCCSFNYLGVRDEIVSYERQLNVGRPRRISSAGHQMGLSVVVNDVQDEYISSLHVSHGVKVMLHYSYSYPDENVPQLIIPTGYEIFLPIWPQITDTEEAVRNLQPYKRSYDGCCFEDEQELATMKRYTYRNCLMECRMDAVVRLCGCLPFTFPNKDIYRICSLFDVPCLSRNKRSFYMVDLQLERNKQTRFPTCNCMPDCISREYPVQDYGVKLQGGIIRRNSLLARKYDIKNHTLFHVYYGNFMATKYRRKVVDRLTILLGYSGGLLGLFNGFSFVAAFEVIYIFTSQLVAHSLASKRKRKRNKNLMKIIK